VRDREEKGKCIQAGSKRGPCARGQSRCHNYQDASLVCGPRQRKDWESGKPFGREETNGAP